MQEIIISSVLLALAIAGLLFLAKLFLIALIRTISNQSFTVEKVVNATIIIDSILWAIWFYWCA